MSLQAASMSLTSKTWAVMAREASVWPNISLFSTASPGCLQMFWRWLAGPRASTSLAQAQAVPSSAPAPSARTPCRTLTQHPRTIPRLVVFERTLWVFQPDVTFEIYFLFRITKEIKKKKKRKAFKNIGEMSGTLWRVEGWPLAPNHWVGVFLPRPAPLPRRLFNSLSCLLSNCSGLPRRRWIPQAGSHHGHHLAETTPVDHTCSVSAAGPLQGLVSFTPALGDLGACFTTIALATHTQVSSPSPTLVSHHPPKLLQPLGILARASSRACVGAWA